MKPETHRFGKATVGLVAVLVIAAGFTVGMAVASTGPSDGPSAVSTVDQYQVDDNEAVDNDTTSENTELTRSNDRLSYSTPAGEGYHVENLSIDEADEPGMVTVSAELTNPNDWPAVQHVEIRVDGDVTDRKPFALQPNETDVVSFSVDTSEWMEGDHHVSILSYDHGEIMTVSAEKPVVEASVTFDDQESDGATVTVDEVTVPEGGFVVIHETASLQEGDALGSTVGVSEYLDPGTHENVSVTLFDVPGVDFGNTTLDADTEMTAMAHLDTNENEEFDFVSEEGAEDGPYTIDGEPVVDTAMVTIAEEPTTTEEPVNETTTEVPVNETTTTEVPVNETTTTEVPVNETTTTEAGA